MVKSHQVSYYQNIFKTEDGLDSSVFDILDKIKSGFFEDQIHPVRICKDKLELKRLKSKLPGFTCSGIFKERNASGIVKHSQLLALDLDDVDNINDVKSELCCDPMVLACFISCSGKGLCVIYRINPKAHLESFLAISEHIYKKFNQEVSSDSHCKDVSRLRFISHDPDLYLNKDAQVFFVAPLSKREAAERKYKPYAVSSETSERIINAIEEKAVDVTSVYQDWINAGFALVNTYGETGREYYHKISRFNPEYDHEKTDKKYSHLIKTTRGDLNMGVIYNLAKRQGIQIYTEKEKAAIKITSQSKKSGLDPTQIKSNLKKFGEFTDDEVEECSSLIDQAFTHDVITEKEGLVSEIRFFISNNNSLKRNQVTRQLELNGKPITDEDINSIYLECRTAIEDTTKDLVKSILFSNFIVGYNPILDFFEEYKNTQLKDRNLNNLLASIHTDTPNAGLFITKWLVGMIASAFGDHSPLMLVLCGGQNTGKTYWFRHLLPDPLRSFFADCKFQNGKDDEILMTKKWILLDDELSGKSKAEEQKTKALLSKEEFSIREPYGTVSRDLKRLAVLCGTSNNTGILTDLTGNRRILPINVLSIDHNLYNQVNKYHLLIELFNLHQSGYTHHLTKDDIKILNDSTSDFEAISLEEELIFKYYSVPKNGDIGVSYVTATDIALKIQPPGGSLRVVPVKIGQVLKNAGFQQVKKKVNGNSMRVYKVIENTVHLYT